MSNTNGLYIKEFKVSCPNGKQTGYFNGTPSGYVDIDISNYKSLIIGNIIPAGSGSSYSVQGSINGGNFATISISLNTEVDISSYDTLRLYASVTDTVLATNQSYSVTYKNISFR